ncbi:MAG: hypothetical protein R3B57_05470 [Phycisphaerales bacterium]
MKLRRPNDACRHPRAQLPGHRKGDPFVRALLWRLLGQHMCRYSFHNWYRLRQLILSAFGARIHPSAKIRRTARIDCPWNLTMGELSALGDHANISARAPVRVGSSCTLSQYTKIFTQAHDPLDPDYEIYTAPVTIKDDAWLAADVVVLPGVTIEAGVVVGARALVDRSLPSWKICAGEPALPRRQRPFYQHREPAIAA